MNNERNFFFLNNHFVLSLWIENNFFFFFLLCLYIFKISKHFFMLRNFKKENGRVKLIIKSEKCNLTKKDFFSSLILKFSMSNDLPSLLMAKKKRGRLVVIDVAILVYSFFFCFCMTFKMLKVVGNIKIYFESSVNYFFIKKFFWHNQGENFYNFIDANFSKLYIQLQS